MKISILTLFPEFFDGFLTNSIIKRAIAKEKVEVEIINIRDFTTDKYGRVDSAPVGGGAGLIMKCQPVIDCLKSVKKENSHVILLSPRGKTYNQARARSFAKNYEHIVLICGHYEGTDERINKYIDELVSVGDFILTGGEIGAEIIADSIIRLLLNQLWMNHLKTDYLNILNIVNHSNMMAITFQISFIPVIMAPLKNGERSNP